MKELALKYGCNPNQKPSRIFMNDGSELPIKVLNGTPGYINLLDALNGWQLVRELKEELAVDVIVGERICTVEYDYPKFHLTMHCFFCTLPAGCRPTLLEHEAARWLDRESLGSVNWLPADVEVVKLLA